MADEKQTAAEAVVQETVRDTAKPAKDKAADIIKVELKEIKEGIINTIYHTFGSTEFKDGVSEVESKVAKLLKELGVIK